MIYSHFNHIKELFEAVVGTGQEIQINCGFDDNKGELNPITQLDTKITIRKNGKPISFTKEYYNGIYTRVTASNNGDKYECEVDNRFYSRTSNTVALNIHCKFKERANENVVSWMFYILGVRIWVVMLIQRIVKNLCFVHSLYFCMIL